MTRSDKDDLADALARLADGEVAPSEHEPAAPSEALAHDSMAKPQRAAAPADRTLPAASVAPPPPMPQRPLIATPAEAVEQIVMDDDDVAMPAPDADVFVPRHSTARRAALYQTLEFRRTLIPVLLTCGVLMIGFASARHLVGSDSPLADLPTWVPPVLLVGGLVLLVLAVLNMLSVKHRMAEYRVRVDKLRRRLL